MNWISVLILIAVVWLALYVLSALMAQHRQELMEQYVERRNREAMARTQREQAERSRPAGRAEPVNRPSKPPPAKP